MRLVRTITLLTAALLFLMTPTSYVQNNFTTNPPGSEPRPAIHSHLILMNKTGYDIQVGHFSQNKLIGWPILWKDNGLNITNYQPQDTFILYLGSNMIPLSSYSLFDKLQISLDPTKHILFIEHSSGYRQPFTLTEKY